MARDYAAPRRKTRRTGPGIKTGLLLGLLIGLGVAIWVWWKQPPAPMEVIESHTADAQPETPPEPTPEKRFTFYELLPNQEKLVPSTGRTTAPPAEPTRPAAAADDHSSYVIQAASYRSPDEAERQKASLALLGLQSKVEKVTIDNTDTYYRVRIGPVTGRAAAEDVLAQLSRNGIDGMAVKLR